ncbi:sodium:glutamate symporter [Alkalilimnicola ehrlichii]|uniref:Sodium:glutamate symporter n=1 Tax=Alkalilimnicola ehrlichii TaxID=351052 RepID=A0A3E0WJF8_9GAMM|nr:sodium/glutamate symporter [Alkalilimnicola ehrlichii]RFA25835.1 sodium:glutamate symporter [Alkalilimnicola ehrlichii]RFA33112.1 sodium:glutamate symporter [Alkalilimnicola ehrlichii]
MALSLQDVFVAVLLIGFLLLIANVIRAKVKLFRSLFLPGSIIAGVLALLLGPQILGNLAEWLGIDALGAGLFPATALEAWRGLPGILINVVFAALFLGSRIPGIREIWYRAGPQVVIGQTMAWGQYVVGIILALLVLTPLFGLPPMAGALIEIGFEGGHGTAAGMAETFAELGFPEGADLALGLATIGLVSGVILGTILINWAARRGDIDLSAELDQAKAAPLSKAEIKQAEQDKRLEQSATDPLSLHLGLVAIAIGIGWLLHQALIWLEAATLQQAGMPALMRHVPLFPLAMLGGVFLQIAIDRAGLGEHVSRRIMSRISGTALDFTIVAALATLSLMALGEHLVPFLLLALTGILWSLFCVIVLAPRLIPFNWFERGIGDFGQSMGVTVTGILLMRMADPQNRSGALQSFGYKQLLFEPVVGGGLFTAASLPLIVQFGPVAVLLFTAFIMTAWLIFGFLYFGPMAKEERSKQRAGP